MAGLAHRRLLSVVLSNSAYLTASVFARLRQREAGAGRVSALALFNYVMRKVWHQQTRIGLSLYDVVGRGFLREIVSLSQSGSFGTYIVYALRTYSLSNFYENFQIS